MEPTEQELARFVDANVHLCLSSLVSTLAQGAGLRPKQRQRRDEAADLADLTEQAFDLCSPVEDYEEAARQEGYEVRHDLHGFYWCSAEEGKHEDAGNPSAGFDGRPHFTTIEDAASACCHVHGFEPYEWEVYEHWAVSEWFAEQLEAKGERIDRDFAGLCVWGRTTTGQPIAMDAVVKAIWRELHEEEA